MNLSGKKVMILGCNDNQVPYIKAIKDRGAFVVGTDLNDQAPGRSLCDQFYQVGYDDIDGLQKVAEEVSLTAQDLIFTAGAQFAHYGAAKVAETAGIPYPKPEVIQKCLDKVLFYPWFEDHQLPIPKTRMIKDKIEFDAAIKDYEVTDRLFLKSDYSKNPHYVYEFSPNNIPNIVWTKDRFFRNHYVLQRKFEGESLRVNLFGDAFSVFKINEHVPSRQFYEKIQDTDCIAQLQSFVRANALSDFLVKFDVILDHQLEYVVLDIGLDPPYRMRKFYELNALDFPYHYVAHYLMGQLDYSDLRHI